MANEDPMDALFHVEQPSHEIAQAFVRSVLRVKLANPTQISQPLLGKWALAKLVVVLAREYGYTPTELLEDLKVPTEALNKMIDRASPAAQA